MRLFPLDVHQDDVPASYFEVSMKEWRWLLWRMVRADMMTLLVELALMPSLSSFFPRLSPSLCARCWCGPDCFQI